MLDTTAVAIRTAAIILTAVDTPAVPMVVIMEAGTNIRVASPAICNGLIPGLHMAPSMIRYRIFPNGHLPSHIQYIPYNGV